MRKRIIGAALVAVVVGGDAEAARRDACERARPARRVVVQLYGERAAGRNICRDGVRARAVYRSKDFPRPPLYIPASRGQERAYARVLRDFARPVFSMGKRPVLPMRAPAGTASYVLFPTGTAACIVSHESGGDPGAQNGQYHGIAQWSGEAWARHGGHRYASDPFGASYQQQLRVLSRGLRLYGCRDWCPFDGC